MIKIKCFGIARDIFGTDLLEIDSEDITVGDLRDQLAQLNAEITTIKGYMVAVNQEYAEDSDVITPGAEVAIIPPVSGG